MKKFQLFFCLILIISGLTAHAQQSVARRWNEALIQSIREDFARPPVHARNLFHLSMAMYDAWAAYDTVANTYLLGKQVGNYNCPFNSIVPPSDVLAAQNKAISYAAYRVLIQRFQGSPNASAAFQRFALLMAELGYDPSFTSIDYSDNDPASLGNYIGYSVINMGLSDGANEIFNYAAPSFVPANPVLQPDLPGNPNIIYPNLWQPLQLNNAIDQNGNPIPATQVFQSPLWGNVQPFAMTAADTIQRVGNNNNFTIYHDPGPQPTLDTGAITEISEFFKWNMALVSAWGTHMTTTDSVVWDISPASIGNVQSYPETPADYPQFYKFNEGGDSGMGRSINPKTGAPYTPQLVPRGDYTRVLAEFWADGPNSETPPGHWFSILNKTMGSISFQRRFNGKGPLLEPLEWDVKAYFILGGAVHDAAISAWSIKGWYNAVRPISAIRYMADKGQSSDPALPSYHVAGLPLIPGYIEMVQAGDTLAGANNEHLGKVKLYTWRGPNTVNPNTPLAGVGWVLAEKWWPFQVKTFVTPPFGGYISGHSTFSSAAAEALTLLTGDEYFPGGMGQFAVNPGFLKVEVGPSVPVVLQWATYRDASDQTSLSRIWGGIHPPFDDIPGRKIGKVVGEKTFLKAREYFYTDNDLDGFYSYEDCDDQNAALNPNTAEICDGMDNNCNGQIDEGVTLYSYYSDQDGDGFGRITAIPIITCSAVAPMGMANNNLDCNDGDNTIYPNAPELCDGLDNNCDGNNDENLPLYSYYVDQDGDGYGFAMGNPLLTCAVAAPMGYVNNNLDCNDNDNTISPAALEICDGIDNNCNGNSDEDLDIFVYYLDADGDGYGTIAVTDTTCIASTPVGYSLVLGDCNDANAVINPTAIEVIDSLDNDCNGLIDDVIGTQETTSARLFKVFPNPVTDVLNIYLETPGAVYIEVRNPNGQVLQQQNLVFEHNYHQIQLNNLPSGMYFLYGYYQDGTAIVPIILSKI